MKLSKQLLVLFILFIPSLAWSQSMNIQGTVVDTTTNKGLEYSKAMLVRIKDSVLVGFKQTKQDGVFEFRDLPVDTFQLIVSHPKYGERDYYFFGSENNKEFLLNRIILPNRGTTFEEITIFAYKDPVYFKGDTLVYVADSFATKPNAVVEDLLKKLPGITVEKDGKLKSQGKEIAKVLVDGDEFFGSDPTIATKNLSASGVEAVKVYEKENPDAAAGDEKIQVLDLQLKDNAKRGYFGRLSFANDFRKFYEGEALANRFNKKQKISFFLLSSNTTRSSLSWQDANKYGVEAGNAYSYNAETDNWEMNENFVGTDGFPQTLKSGLYYTDEVSKKLKLSANYTYTQNRLRTHEERYTQYFLEDTVYYTSAENNNNLKSDLHELNFGLVYKIDSLTTLEFDPKVKFKTTEKTYLDKNDFLSEEEQLMRNTINERSFEQSGTNLKTRLALTRNFMKKGRKLQVLNNFVYDDFAKDGKLKFTDNYTGTPSLNTYTDQVNDEHKLILSNLFNVVYTEPLNDKFKIEVNYELFNTVNKRNKRTFNESGGAYDELDSTYSNRFKSNKNQHRIGVALIYEYKKHVLTAGVKFRTVAIDNFNYFDATTIRQDVNNFLPHLNYRYKISQSKSFNFRYITSSFQPTIEQLQPINDNSNPNNISIGNPDLIPNYSHRFSAQYNSYKAITGSYIYAGINYEYKQKDFSTSIQYDEFGRSIFQYVNVKDNQWGSFYLGGGIPVYKKIISLQPQISAYFTEQNSLVNQMKNITNTYSADGSLRLQVTTEKVEVTTGANLGINKNRSILGVKSAQTDYTQTYSIDVKYNLPWRMVFRTNASYTKYSNRTAGYNLNPFIWNMSVEKKMGKLDQWIVEAQGFDLLNQNVNINRNIANNYIVDIRTNIIARYFMLKLTYKFNSTKVKEEDNDGF